MTAPVTAREDHQAMEFSVSKTALLNELSTTQGVVERKTTIPILSNLLVEAKGSTLTITATDLELSIRTSCEAKVKKEGAGTIPAKKFHRLAPLYLGFGLPIITAAMRICDMAERQGWKKSAGKSKSARRHTARSHPLLRVENE